MVNLMCIVAGDSPRFSFLVPADFSSSVRELQLKILELQGITCDVDATQLFLAVRRRALDKYEDWLTADGEWVEQLQNVVENDTHEDAACWLRGRFVAMEPNCNVGVYFPVGATLPRFRVIHLVILLPAEFASEDEDSEDEIDQGDDPSMDEATGEEGVSGCDVS